MQKEFHFYKTKELQGAGVDTSPQESLGPKYVEVFILLTVDIAADWELSGAVSSRSSLFSTAAFPHGSLNFLFRQ